MSLSTAQELQKSLVVYSVLLGKMALRLSLRSLEMQAKVTTSFSRASELLQPHLDWMEELDIPLRLVVTFSLPFSQGVLWMSS